MKGIEFAPAAILFDMDGLMIDSERAMQQCWRDAARNLGHTLDDALWLRMIGLHDRDCLELLKTFLSETDAGAVQQACYADYRERVRQGMPLMPGVLDVLEILRRRGLPRAVVTSTMRERALQKLESCGLLPYFDIIVTGSDVVRPKPAPEGYLLAAKGLGVEPNVCVVLEDSATGVRAALAAGMTPIQVPDLVDPDAATHALGHRIVDSLASAFALIEPRLMPV